MLDGNASAALQHHIRNESIKNFFINVALNAALAYWLLQEFTAITAWGEHGYGKDLFITGFLLSAIITLIFIIMYRRKRGNSEHPTLERVELGLVAQLPFNPWLSALIFGLLGVLVAVPLLLGILALFNTSAMSPLHYAMVKGLWAGLLAAVLVPLAIRHGLRGV